MAEILTSALEIHKRETRHLAWVSQGVLAVIIALSPTFQADALASPAKEEVYEKPDAFVEKAFGGQAPKPKVLWLTKAIQNDITAIMGRRLPQIRMRYWLKGERSVWILEEIGKEQPITAGFIVDGGQIVETNVLVYRETRGWEIKYPAFRGQFTGATLNDAGQLDQNIDGISGATLSVNAMRKMATLALHLHKITASEKRS